MKVAIVNHGVFPDVIGGMERHTYNLAKFLKDAGVAVDVLVPEPRTQTAYPFPVHHLPWPQRPLWSFLSAPESGRGTAPSCTHPGPEPGKPQQPTIR